MMRLGVNLDHVATLRQARGGQHPSPAEAAKIAQAAGADGITIHLREDRRHIQDSDLPEIQRATKVPVNLEMALHPKIIQIALRYRPEKVCIVPERRQELTTEGGLNLFAYEIALKRTILRMHKKKVEVSLFIAPAANQIKEAARLGADAIEIHTGAYADSKGAARRKELKRIQAGAKLAKSLGLKVHAGHGLDYENVKPIARIPEIEELNIGYSIVTHALFVGLAKAVQEMKSLIR